MKPYNTKISLVKNGRGVYCIDTTMGCKSGLKNEVGGCYNDCYAARIAKRYGHDFTQTVIRDFVNESHKRRILSQLRNVRMSFIRIGSSGDPSENWAHTIKIIKTLSRCNLEIVIITRHWETLTDIQLEYLSTLNVCINTSVSALDKPEIMEKCLEQYHRIKPYCKSVLRIVSCDFNIDNEIGHRLAKIQFELFKNESTLDTVFRPSKKNKFITDGIINVKEEVFNGKKQLASKFNRKTYMGKCSNCKEMCGVNIETNMGYNPIKKLVKQLNLFDILE